jgi:vacuolar-type H+-ATPase subunit H
LSRIVVKCRILGRIYRKNQTALAIYIETRISKLDVADLGKAEILKQIKDAEEKVREMTKQAEERRKQLQADGKRAAIQRTETAAAALKKKLDSEVAEAQANIDVRKRALLEEGNKKASELASNARLKMNQAKEFVLSEFERAVDA